MDDAPPAVDALADAALVFLSTTDCNTGVVAIEVVDNDDINHGDNISSNAGLWYKVDNCGNNNNDDIDDDGDSNDDVVMIMKVIVMMIVMMVMMMIVMMMMVVMMVCWW